jgi:hypothetical protein
MTIRHATFLGATCLALCLVLTGCRPSLQNQGGRSQTTQAEPANPFKFFDAAASLQIDFTYRNGKEAEQNAILESLGGGVGVFDYDADDQPDLIFAGGGGFDDEGQPRGLSSVLYRGNSSGRFQDTSLPAGIPASQHYTHGIAAADFDSDGFPDVLVTGYGGITLWHNHGDGTFTDATVDSQIDDRSWSSSAGWGDIDGDGNLDLYLAHYVDWSPANNPRCSGGRNNAADVCPPRRFQGLDDSLYLSNGDGTFRDASVSSGLVKQGKGLGVILVDIDQDGDLDIYVANDTTDNFLYFNDGQGHLSERGMASGTAVDDQGVSNGSMGVAVLDFGNQGLPDLWVANFEDETFALYRNEGNGLFRHSSAQVGLSALGTLLVGFGTVCGDFDGDGDEDIAVANGHVVHHPANAPVRQLPLLLLNDHQRFLRMSFPQDTYLGSPHTGRGLAMGDLDHDGDLDLVFCNSNEPAAIEMNVSAPLGAWLKIRLIGTRSNRDAVGAYCVIRTTGGDQLRHRYGGGSYLSTSDCHLCFGIPKERTLRSLEVHWPGGQVTRLSHDDLVERGIDHSPFLTIVEPNGTE